MPQNPQPPLPTLPLQADERTMLVAFLDFYRSSLKDRALGLTHEQLQHQHPPTTLTLSRLIGHMAMVEYIWFRNRFSGDGMPEPFASLDWARDADAEKTMAQTWSTAELMSQFDVATADSSARLQAASALDAESAEANPEGEHWSMRWILVHMIEEYARHCGHADLIREAIDGDLATK